ncbi:MAG: menaquinone biosynthesis protein [Deltaproteobacteria bacterium]|nr:menaquinone biosynthesis protein [Deltaproteobacteria bacterium]
MVPLSSEKLKLGKIGFLNVVPIYYPLETGIISHPFNIVSGTPACLNRLMAAGHLDLSVVSSIEYARHPERYFILPDLSISCRGAVKSVLLLSRVPVEQLDSRTITVTTQSHTSVALLRILLAQRYGIRAELRPGRMPDHLEAEHLPLAFLAIGDEALQLNGQGIFPFSMDLGEVWHTWTGLPFVFALWVIQKNAAEKLNGSLRTALEILCAAKAWGRNHLDRVCRAASEKGVLTFEALQDYYQCLDYDLCQNEQTGLNLFFRFLEQMEEIPRVPVLEIASPLACVA